MSSDSAFAAVISIFPPPALTFDVSKGYAEIGNFEVALDGEAMEFISIEIETNRHSDPDFTVRSGTQTYQV